MTADPGISLLRWVERPDGELEQVWMSLTPEFFLNPQVGDHMNQGTRHNNAVREIAGLLKCFFHAAPDAVVTSDLKHFLGPGLPQPSPDISVIRGVRDKDVDWEIFDVVAEGVRPCLIVEVVCPLFSSIRQTDLEDKVEVYQQAGIPEYLIVDFTLSDRRFRLLGYRLDGSEYQPIKPDAEGRLLSKTTGLWFQASPDGDRVQISEHMPARPLLTHHEEETLRKVAEAEVARLKAELDRLRGGS